METVTLTPNFIIKQLRVGHYLSQQDVANVLGVTRQKYNCYERSGYNISIQRLARIAEFYNISLDCISGISKNYKAVSDWLNSDESEAVKYFEANKTNLVLKYGIPNVEEIFENIPFIDEE